MSDPKDPIVPVGHASGAVQEARVSVAIFGMQLHTQRIWRLLEHDPVLRSKTAQAIQDGSLFMLWGKA